MSDETASKDQTLERQFRVRSKLARRKMRRLRKQRFDPALQKGRTDWQNVMQDWEPLEAFFLRAFFWIAVVSLPIIFILGLIALIWIIIFPFHAYVGDSDGLRNFVFALAGLVGAVFGLYQLANSATRTRLTREDTGTRRESERNDRYVKAVELLKDPDDSVRMGGIYALERLAVEDDGKYFKTVIEVLAAYIRYRTTATAPRLDRNDNPVLDARSKPIYEYLYSPRRKAGEKPEKQKLPEEATEDEKQQAEENHRNAVVEWAQGVEHTEPVKAAMKSLSRLWETRFAPSAGGESVDLRVAWLVGIEAIGFQLSRWQFQDAHLEGADLGDAYLNGANLLLSRLSFAYLRDAHLEGAYLGLAHLQGAELEEKLTTVNSL